MGVLGLQETMKRQKHGTEKIQSTEGREKKTRNTEEAEFL